MNPSPRIKPPVRDAYVRVWRTVRKIPRGRVSTYGTIALLAGMPGHSRLVGYALHNLPEGADVPWHRVVNAQGKISLPRASGSGRRQAQLLIAEGVRFDAGSIRLEAHGWPVSAFRRSRHRST